MKTFAEFQEEIKKKVPPVISLGGGGGGTDSITAKSSSKSVKKRIGDVAKVLTRPFHKKRVDPTEKFATEGVAALSAGSKVVPALMTGIGAAGMIMQSRKKKDSSVPRDDQGMPDPLAKLGRKAKVTLKKGMKDFKREVKRSAKDISKGLKAGKDVERTSATGRINVVQQELQKKADAGDKTAKEMLKKFGKRFKENIRRNRNMDEEVMAAPTNNASSGAIAGLPPDNPPVKRKKRYIYGGTGSRKMWMTKK